MTIQHAKAPTESLYRVGRAPNPLAWNPWKFHGKGRFDGPARGTRFRTLYFSEQRVAAFIETLGDFRLDLAALASLHNLPNGDFGDDIPVHAFGRVPVDWHLKRRVATAYFSPGQQWLDLRSDDTLQELRIHMQGYIRQLGYKDLDFGDLMGRDRRLTRKIAVLAYQNNFQGLCYCSRFEPRYDCWALFEESLFVAVGSTDIERNDPDLLEACRLLKLLL